ncbi:mucin-2-like isoform X2 [Ostrea edulis]|uniref:mucin-2-like isoform X2 n=1 Tax=Ostrea edulis TaxID=37623 RepID=UPI0024AE9A2E|nr:mucin-2-like isoform X2 [Ostrea edulis]
MAWMTMIILMVNSFGIYYSEGSDSRHKISKSITLHQSQESSIKSPGYPTKHYEKDTVYIWTVTAPGTTEEITINILDLDIQYTPGIPCDDYLKIQDTDDENFAISKQCEKPWRKTVVAKGNKLKITLFSNYDRLTGKGFNLILRVTKTKPTTTQPTTKGIPTTTPVPMTSPTSVQTTTKHLVTRTKRTTPRPTPKDIPTTTPVLVTSSTSNQTTSNHLDLNLSSTNMGSLKTNVTTLTTSITTTAMKTATATTKTSTILLTLTSEKTIPTMTPTNTPTLSTANEVLNNASSTRNATTVISTTVSASFPSGTFISSRSTQHSSVQSITNSTPTQSFTPLQMNETTIISSSAGGSTTAVQAGNATKTTQTSTESETTSTAFFQEETLLLVLAIAVVEMTVLVIGVLAVRRQRQKRVTITRRPIEGNNRPVSRKTIYSMPNVYDVIPFDEVDDSDEENPYKDLQDGVYDTTFKRRSRLSGKPNRDDSRGSYFSHFLRNSKIFGSWKLKENQPMEMKTFRG